jgi:hypothetical protein
MGDIKLKGDRDQSHHRKNATLMCFIPILKVGSLLCLKNLYELSLILLNCLELVLYSHTHC